MGRPRRALIEGRTGRREVVAGRVECGMCHGWKPISEFVERKSGPAKGLLFTYCDDCSGQLSTVKVALGQMDGVDPFVWLDRRTDDLYKIIQTYADIRFILTVSGAISGALFGTQS